MMEYVNAVTKDGKYIALLIVVESSKNNKGDVIKKYSANPIIDYEREAIVCVENWRQNGGKHSQCPIYAINVNGNPPSKKTIENLEEMNVIYKEEYFPETKEFPCGYWNTPLGLQYLESMIYEDLLIHIDLDMYLVRELTDDILYLPEDKICKIAKNKYRPTDSLDKEIYPKYPFEIATNFIISRRKDKFYKHWWSNLKQFWHTRAKNIDDEKLLCIYEERICDEMHFQDYYNFEFFDMNYQLEHDSTKEPFFIHCHLNNNRFEKLIVEYFKLKK